MPPEASSLPDSGSNFTDTSTSVNGPAGATITLKSFLVARCTKTFLPTGAPGKSSTIHCPPIVVQPSIPLASKSNFCSVTPSGILISGGAARGEGDEPNPYAPNAVNAILNSPLRDTNVSSTADPLVQLLRHDFPLGSLRQGDVGHGMTVLQGGHDADDAVPLVLLHGLGRRGIEGALGLGHRLALGLRRREIVAAGDRLGLRHFTRLVVHDDLGELLPLHRVDGQLELSVLHLILRRNRPAFLRTCSEPALERDLCVPQRLGEFRMLRVVGLLRPAHRHREHPRHEERQRQRCLFHVLLSQVLVDGGPRSSASTPCRDRRRSPCRARAGPDRPAWPPRGL